MQSGEVPPHWADLVANHSESATDTNIDVANTWAAEDFACEGDQDQIDPNLVLTRSFKTPPHPQPSEAPQHQLVSFEDDKYYDANTVAPPIIEKVLDAIIPPVPAPDIHTMPELGDIDSMTLRRSKRARKPSSKVLANEEQATEANTPQKGHRNRATKMFGLFTTWCLVSVSTLPATFASPRTSFEKSIAHLSVVNQHFDGTLNYLHPLAFATKIQATIPTL